jgi:hypothetical protein
MERLKEVPPFWGAKAWRNSFTAKVYVIEIVNIGKKN